MKKRALVSQAEIRDAAMNVLGELLVGANDGRKVTTEELKTRRAAQMSILYHDNGWSLERVGLAYNLSRERVRQVFASYGLETRAPTGSMVYNAPPADLSNLRRVKTSRGNEIESRWVGEFEPIREDEEVVLEIRHNTEVMGRH